jgi:hypothetical protein
MAELQLHSKADRRDDRHDRFWPSKMASISSVFCGFVAVVSQNVMTISMSAISRKVMPGFYRFSRSRGI